MRAEQLQNAVHSLSCEGNAGTRGAAGEETARCEGNAELAARRAKRRHEAKPLPLLDWAYQEASGEATKHAGGDKIDNRLFRTEPLSRQDPAH